MTTHAQERRLADLEAKGMDQPDPRLDALDDDALLRLARGAMAKGDHALEQLLRRFSTPTLERAATVLRACIGEVGDAEGN